MGSRAWWCAGLLAGMVGMPGCVQGDLDLPDFQLTDWTGDLPDPTLVTLTTTAGTSVSSTSVSSTSVGDDSSSSSDTSSESSTGDPPDSVCDPQPDEDIETAVIVDSMVGWAHDPTDLVTSCVITWIGTLGSALHVGLACEDGSHTLDVSAVGPSALMIGDFVELGIHIEVPWWANVSVVVRRDGELMIAASTAEALPGELGDQGPSADFFAPLQLALLDDVCGIEPEDDEPCGAIICSDPCTIDRRQALVFLEGDDVEVVYDRGEGQLGETAIEVGEAIEHVEVMCPDVANAWYSFVAVRGN